MRLLKTVLHVHTDYSYDSENSVTHLIESARRHGIDCLAVTDHNTLAGAWALANAAPRDLRVIVGEEVTTARGHLIGLFLRDRIEPGLTPRRTAEAIKEQGGLVVAPHPFTRLFGCGLRDAICELIDLLDLVEVHNAQSPFPPADWRAERFAREHDVPGVVGVDSHHRHSLHACYQWLPTFTGPTSFRTAARSAKLVRGRHSPAYFLRSARLVACGRLLRFATLDRYGRNCSSPATCPPPRTNPMPDTT